ncbi:copper chaperone PCu(A)C, partial [Brevundimonas bullata]|uniref:copper chaperone PCu(A)C n=1 Tax=Brevundimonas bullata TaxID=13160 RepID=UPI002FD9BDB7
MKSLFALAGLSAAALTLAACGQPAEKPADAAAVPGTVTVADAWCRPTPNGAKAGGCYVTLTAGSDDRLVSVSTPLADTAQIHEMKMENGMMSMSELKDGLPLPAGQ